MVEPMLRGEAGHEDALTAVVPATLDRLPGEAAQPGPQQGERVAERYELLGCLGRGGMGSVFKARDTTLPRHVAIKFLNAENPELSELFLREARTTANLQHENIVTIHEVGQHRRQPFMVLEYLSGTSLWKMLSGGRALSPARAVELAVPIARGLAAAHEKGIVHRDLKPDNVMVTQGGVVKILDFGIAKVLRRPSFDEVRSIAHGAADWGALDGASAGGDGPDSHLTRPGALMGTLPWMAPEQFGADTVDQRTDLFSFGLLLFVMLSGRHPLDGLKGMQFIVVGELERPMPRLRSIAPSVPEGLAEVVDRCLSKRKAERFPDAVALLRALEPFLPGRMGRTPRELAKSPYPGLGSFQERDAHRFFGRSRETAALVNRVRESPLTVVVGPSGVGKTSLLRAAVVPALKDSGEGWETLVLRPGRAPLWALATAIASSPLSAEAGTGSVASLVEALLREPGLAGRLLRSWCVAGRRVLVAVDQAEELYTLGQPAERATFLACLRGVADDASSPLRVLMTLRSDYLHRLGEDSSFGDLGSALSFLGAPSRDGLREALEEPAQAAGYHFDVGVVDDLLDEVAARPVALPLLQFVASQLWELRDASTRRLTEASYRAVGGIEGALARHADQVLDGLPAKLRAGARTLFLRLVTPERTRAVVALDELPALLGDRGELERLVEQLVRARLLAIEKAELGSTVEIIHESLIHRWPTLARWLEDAGEDVAFLERLRASSKGWAAAGRAGDLLWRGEVLDDARRFRRRYQGELSELEEDFLQQAIAVETKAARRRRLFALVGVVALGAVAAASAVAVAVIQVARAEAERQAGAARTAEAQARDRLVEVEHKERARAEAEARALERLVEVERKERERAEAAGLAEASSAALAVKNRELLEALRRAETARRLADQTSEEARQAREETERAAAQTQALLQRERARVRRLQEQFGSPVVDVVKWRGEGREE